MELERRDIELFARTFVFGVENKDTVQVSREPITIETKNNATDTLFDRLGLKEKDELGSLCNELTEKLFEYVMMLKNIRAEDKKFSKAVMAEEKRQAAVVKKMKAALTT